MNILQIITPSRLAGAERSTASLCEHLQKAGHRVVVGCKAGSPLIEVMHEMGLDARPLPIAGKINPRAPFLIAALARREKAAVLHSQLSTAAVHTSLAGRMCGIPTVAHVRALNTALCYRAATRVIAVSAAVKVHLVGQGLPADRIDVVYNGVDPDHYFLPCSREEARRRLGLPGDGCCIGVIGHLSPRKGHPVFLKAFQIVAARHPGTFAVLLGEGDQAPLRRLAAELGVEDRVIFPGFHHDVLPFYAATDIVALPSVEGEGLPRALLEGGLLGRPSVASHISGVPEIVRDRETGFVVPIGDAQALADRLGDLVADAGLREEMGKAAREYVAATFTVRAMTAGVLASYEKAGVSLR